MTGKEKHKRRKTPYTRTKRITVFLRFYYYIAASFFSSLERPVITML